MINDYTVSELLYCNNENSQTGCIIEIALWNDEIKEGFPSVITSIQGVEIQLALQDVLEIISLYQSFIEKLSPFMNPLDFEKNKIVLKKTSDKGIVRLFERYHKFMKETK